MSNGTRRGGKDLRNLRKFLFGEQNGFCYWCKCQLQMERPHDDDYATVDELMPRKRGGKQNRVNSVAACRPCNMGRGDTIAPPKIITQSSVGLTAGAIETRHDQ